MPVPTQVSFAGTDGRDKSVSKTTPLPTLEICSSLAAGTKANVGTVAVPLVAVSTPVAGVSVQNDSTVDMFVGDVNGQTWRVPATGTRDLPLDDLAKVYVKFVSGTTNNVNFIGYVP